MKSIPLKCKVLSLAAEARIIRKEENKLYENRVTVDTSKSNSKRIQRKLKPWVVSSGLHTRLHLHRTVVVRDEARAAQLAYGFLRGKWYSSLESHCKKPPDRKRVLSIASRFSTTKPVTEELLNKWFDDRCYSIYQDPIQ